MEADELEVVVRGLESATSVAYNHHVGRSPKATGDQSGVAAGRRAVRLAAAPATVTARLAPREQCAVPLVPTREENFATRRVVGGAAAEEVERALSDIGLPDAAAAHVARLLDVPCVRHEEVTAQASSCCESNAFYRFSAAGALGDFDEDFLSTHQQAWISLPGSFSGGRGAEWLQLELGGLRRVRFVKLRIPVPPAGPLAVKTFHVEVPSGSDGDGGWERVSDDLRTFVPARTPGEPPLRNPEFEYAPFELTQPHGELQCERLRLVFTEAHDSTADAVGLWTVRLL